MRIAAGLGTATAIVTLALSTAPAPIAVEEVVAGEAIPVEPVIYALAEDEAVYATTIATFEDAGYQPPEFVARFHTTTEPCKGHLGLHVVTSDGVSTIHVCVTPDNPLGAEIAREHALSHEVAHAWINQDTTDNQRAAFMELRGLTVWDNGDLAGWADLGAEQAADILLWGMTDGTNNIDFRIDDSDTNNQRAAYKILVQG